MVKLRVKCPCGAMFWSKVMKIKNPEPPKTLVPTQLMCQRCRNVRTMIDQRRGKSPIRMGEKDKKLVIPEINVEYIRQELIKAENKRRQQEHMTKQVEKREETIKKGKPHFDPEEYDTKEEKE